VELDFDVRTKKATSMRKSIVSYHNCVHQSRWVRRKWNLDFSQHTGG